MVCDNALVIVENGLEIHDADRADLGQVVVALEERLDLGGRHVHAVLGEREDPAHPDGHRQLSEPREELAGGDLQSAEARRRARRS